MKISLITSLLVVLLAVTAWSADLPKMIDVGADKCIPCIKMAPILEELKKDFAGQLDVEFIDAWKHRDIAGQYGIRMIPTQVFFAPDGTEIFRHTGFLGREDILKKWQQLGYDFQGSKE